MDALEDYRLLCVPSRFGWRTYAVLDDGVELVEDVAIDANTESNR